MNDLGFPSRKSIIARASMTVAMMLSVALLPGLPIAVQAAAGAPDAIAAAIANPAQGHVYASVPSPLLHYPNIVKGISDIQAFVVAHANANVNFAAPLDAAKYPEAQFIYKFRKP
jgi:hypothetical protein